MKGRFLPNTKHKRSNAPCNMTVVNMEIRLGFVGG